MAKQINEYDKIRTEGTIQLEDRLDFDSTEDNGVTFESAQITVEEFRKYLADFVPTLYNADGQIDALRNIGMNGFAAVWENGTLINKADLNDVGYLLQNSLGVEKGSLGYDVGIDSATLDLKNSSGTYLKAIDGKVGIGDGNTVPFSILDIKGVDGTASNYSFILRNNLDVVFYKTNNLGRTSFGNDITEASSIDANLHVKHASGQSALFEATTGNTDSKVEARQSADTSKNALFEAKNSANIYAQLFSNGSTAALLTDLRGIKWNGGDFAFSFGNTEKARLKSNGNFGINVDPTEKLDVSGNANVSGVYKVGGVSGFTGTGAYTNFTIVGGIITSATV